MSGLYRSKTDKMLGGVCGGMSEAWNISAGPLRFITLALCLFFWIPFFIYMGAWMVMKVKPD